MDEGRLRMIEDQLSEIIAFQNGIAGIFVAWLTGGKVAALEKAVNLAGRSRVEGRHR